MTSFLHSPSLFLFLAFASLPLRASESKPPSSSVIVELWPESRMPGKAAPESETVLPGRGDDVLRLTQVSRPTLEVFPAPRSGATSAPAVIICPGGGYSALAYDKEGTDIARWLTSAGITAAVLKYRVPGNRDGAFQDIQRAVRLARARGADWNIDPARLGVIGFSAGGHLSACASTGFARPAYPPIDDSDRLSARPDFAILVYPAYLDTKGGTVAPELDLSADIPPSLIIHSEDDKSFISGSRIYDAALTAAGRAHDFKLYATGGHGYGLRCQKDARAWPDYVLEWLRRSGIHDAKAPSTTHP